MSIRNVTQSVSEKGGVPCPRPPWRPRHPSSLTWEDVGTCVFPTSFLLCIFIIFISTSGSISFQEFLSEQAAILTHFTCYWKVPNSWGPQRFSLFTCPILIIFVYIWDQYVSKSPHRVYLLSSIPASWSQEIKYGAIVVRLFQTENQWITSSEEHFGEWSTQWRGNN